MSIFNQTHRHFFSYLKKKEDFTCKPWLGCPEQALKFPWIQKWWFPLTSHSLHGIYKYVLYSKESLNGKVTEETSLDHKCYLSRIKWIAVEKFRNHSTIIIGINHTCIKRSYKTKAHLTYCIYISTNIYIGVHEIRNTMLLSRSQQMGVHTLAGYHDNLPWHHSWMTVTDQGIQFLEKSHFPFHTNIQ